MTVTSVGTAGAAGTGLGVTALAASYAAATPVVFNGSGLSFTPAVTAAFAAGTTLRNPRTGVTVSPLTQAHATDSRGDQHAGQRRRRQRRLPGRRRRARPATA